MANHTEIIDGIDERDDLEPVSLDVLMGQFMPSVILPTAQLKQPAPSFEALEKAREDELDVVEFALRYVQHPSTELQTLLASSTTALEESYSAIGMENTAAAHFAAQVTAQARRFLY